MLSRQLGRLSAPVLRHSTAGFAPIAPAKLTTSLSMPLRAVLTQHTAGVCSSAPLHYSMRELHAMVYGTSKKTADELGEDYGIDSYDESHNHPMLWIISIASTGVMAYMLWNNHLPEDKERIHKHFFEWLRSYGIPVAHAEAAQAAVQQATAAVSAGATPAQSPLAADPAKLRALPPNPAAASAAIAAVTSAPIAEDDPPVAGFLRRFFSFMVDSAILNTFMFLLRESLVRLRPNAEAPLQSLGGALCATTLSALIFDLFFLLQCDGKTPGKWICSLRTVKQDFTEMDAATALKSAAARSSLLIAPAFDLVPLVFSSRCREDGQLFHNWVSGTIVIDERAPIEYADE